MLALFLRLLIGVSLLTLGSCTLSQWYPVTGAVIGGSGGAIAGPAGAAAGTAVGYGVGKGAQLMAENKELVETVEALSKGDVDAIVAQRLERGLKEGLDQHQSKFAGMLDQVWAFIRYCLIGVVLWQLIPLLYTMWVHKKTRNEKAHKTEE